MALSKRRAWLTPDSPDALADEICKRVFIPNSDAFRESLGGALYELTLSWNWEQYGSMTPEETAEKFLGIYNQYILGNGCAGQLPSGGKILRLNATGAVEELTDSGWITPTGDYIIPATPPRTELTSQERRCLASANAAHALELLYEVLTDAWSEGLSDAAAIALLVAGIVGIIGSVFGLITASLIAIGTLIFKVVYEVVEFIGADVWDEVFTHKLECVLLGCSTSDTDVVHFDYDCILVQLAGAVNIFAAGASEIRLFGQIYYILQFLGNEALDAAGAATAIESADCAYCDGWCWSFATSGSWDGWVSLPWASGIPAYLEDGIWKHGHSQESESSARVWLIALYYEFSTPVTLTQLIGAVPLFYPPMLLTYNLSTTVEWWGGGGGTNFPGQSGGGWDGEIEVHNILISEWNIDSYVDLQLTDALLRGLGENPFGDDNC